LALIVGNLGVGIMNSTTFLPSSRRNSKIDGNQVNFGTIDFQPHPPTLAPVFANLDQEMDLISGVSTSRWVSRIDPITTTSETSVGPSNEVNSPVSMNTMKSK
jgi:hypothetical protein